MQVKYLIILIAIMCGCQSSGSVDRRAQGGFLISPEQVAHVQELSWFSGTLSDAMVAAAREGKPIFLYWRSKWCSECWQLEAELFSKRRFAELASFMIPVQLDADDEYAQIWSEKLRLGHYPMMAIVEPSGALRIVLDHRLDIHELNEVLVAALSRTYSASEALQRVFERNADIYDWHLLAYSRWEHLLGKRPEHYANQFEKLIHASLNTPLGQSGLRGRFAAKLLSTATATGKLLHTDQRMQHLLNRIHRQSSQLAGRFLNDRRGRMASRWIIAEGSNDILNWVVGNRESEGTKKLTESWLKALVELDSAPGVGRSLRLQIAAALLDLNGMNLFSDELVAQNRNEAGSIATVIASSGKGKLWYRAEASALTSVLARTDNFAMARAFLTNAIDEDKEYRWLYDAQLSELAVIEGDARRAMEAMAKAREGMKGPATYRYGLLREIKLRQSLGMVDQQILRSLIDEYYRVAFDLEDGFTGLAVSTSQAPLAQVYARELHRDVQQALVEEYTLRCESLRSPNRERCIEHFASLEDNSHK